MVSDATYFTACYPNICFPNHVHSLAIFYKFQLPYICSLNHLFIVLTVLGTNIAVSSSLKNEKLSLT